MSRNTEGWILERTDRDAPSEFFPHADLVALSASGRLDVRKRAFALDTLQRGSGGDEASLASLSEDACGRLKARDAFVRSFLEKEQAGRVMRTQASVAAAMHEIAAGAVPYLADSGALDDLPGQQQEKKGSRRFGAPRAPAADEQPPFHGPHPGTLLRWVRTYERDSVFALGDTYAKCGDRRSRFTEEERDLLDREVLAYMSPEKPSKAAIVTRVRLAFKEENARRRSEGRRELKIPGRDAVERAIARLDPLEVQVAREGAEEVRKKRTPVGRGLELTRPMQRVEIDEFEMDLCSVMSSKNLKTLLGEDHYEALGLDEGKGRLWASVAICGTTRCIVGLRLSQTGNRTENAIETLHMSIRDKGRWSNAFDATSPWDMCGLPEKVVTDCGAGYKAFGFRRVTEELGVAHVFAAAGRPYLRARIERLFRTVSTRLLEHLSGRTFWDVIEKGSARPEANAVLDIDDVAYALTRWAVDMYHNTPHKGLGGQTPLECWRELTAIWGAPPAPSLRKRRLVFGEPLDRIAGRCGIEVDGIWYQSRELQEWLLHTHKHEHKIGIRRYHEDIGAIMAWFDGDWHEVPALRDGLDGVHLHSWRATVRQLRQTHAANAEVADEIVMKALGDILARQEAVRATAGLVDERLSDKQMTAFEQRLFVGIDFGAGAGDPAPLSDHVTGHAPNHVPGQGITLPTVSETPGLPARGTALSADPVSAAPGAALRPDVADGPDDPDDPDDPGFTIED